MSDASLNVLAVAGSLSRNSATRIILAHVADRLRACGCSVDLLDFEKEPLALFNPETAYHGPGFASMKSRVDKADVFLLGTPDYHGCISSTLKNFLDHFWQEFTGKLFATVVASHEKGLTVTDQLRTVARQCYAWTLPYGVSFAEKEDLQDGRITNESFRKRLEMLARDIQVYGTLFAHQRRLDLSGSEPCFMARLRK